MNGPRRRWRVSTTGQRPLASPTFHLRGCALPAWIRSCASLGGGNRSTTEVRRSSTSTPHPQSHSATFLPPTFHYAAAHRGGAAGTVMADSGEPKEGQRILRKVPPRARFTTLVANQTSHRVPNALKFLKADALALTLAIALGVPRMVVENWVTHAPIDTAFPLRLSGTRPAHFIPPVSP